jgi:hypothetical protein
LLDYESAKLFCRQLLDKIHCGQNRRHAELVSASIVRQSSAVVEKWTLKQVQGNVFFE